jgi:hypothetical protein
MHLTMTFTEKAGHFVNEKCAVAAPWALRAM